MYRFVLEEDYHYAYNEMLRTKVKGAVKYFPGYCDEGYITFRSGGKVWLKIGVDELIISKGYAWDGCTPKLARIGSVWIGTWDGNICSTTGKPSAYYASLVHDVLYQFLDCYQMPFNRKDADNMFLSILKRDGFPFSRVYWLAVRLFGRLAIRISDMF